MLVGRGIERRQDGEVKGIANLWRTNEGDGAKHEVLRKAASLHFTVGDGRGLEHRDRRSGKWHGENGGFLGEVWLLTVAWPGRVEQRSLVEVERLSEGGTRRQEQQKECGLHSGCVGCGIRAEPFAAQDRPLMSAFSE